MESKNGQGPVIERGGINPRLYGSIEYRRLLRLVKSGKVKLDRLKKYLEGENGNGKN